jgi:DNA-3-methyladenine glycosylase
MKLKQIDTDKFFKKSAFSVARDLLGSMLEIRIGNDLVGGMITEVEVYAGDDDKASMAFSNKITSKTAPMYKKGGSFYVYPSFGSSHFLSVVTGEEGVPEIVLIRAIEPISGLEFMSENRGQKSFDHLDLTSGPGDLCQALSISKDIHNNTKINTSGIYINHYREFHDSEVCVSPRVNVDFAQESKLFPYRFFLKGSEFISQKGKYPKPMTFDTLMKIYSESSVKNKK